MSEEEERRIAARRQTISKQVGLAGKSGRRLTKTEVGHLVEEVTEWLAGHPDHDSALHEGPDLNADIDMTFCPHCNAQNLIQRAHSRIRADIE